MRSIDSEYSAALKLLESSASWCKGAQILAELGDKRGIIPLLRAYERPAESAKICLLRAMRTLGATRIAPSLVQGTDPEQRRLGLHLMELFTDDAYLPLLERSVEDPNPVVKAQARRALRCQDQTPTWEATMVRLLESTDRDLREDAVSTLASHRSPTALAALARHREREVDPDLRRVIDGLVPA